MRLDLLRSRSPWVVAALAGAFAAMRGVAPAFAASHQAAACVGEESQAPLRAFVKVVQDAGLNSDDAVTLMVCIVAVGQRDGIAGYHGELRFDPAAVEVIRVERGAGGTRLENVREPGRLIFAGVAPDGFEQPIVLQARVRPRHAARGLPSIELVIHELSSVNGADLSGHVVTTGYSEPVRASPQNRFL